MAEKNVPVVQELTSNATVGDRVQLREGGDQYVFDGYTWHNTKVWDQLSFEEKNEAFVKALAKNRGAADAEDALYDPTDETKVKAELLKLKTSDREKVLKTLYESGQYGGSKRGNGFANSDINAFSDLLWYANYKKKPFMQALTDYQKDFPKNPSMMSGVGRTPPRQVTNPDEIKAVFRKTAQGMLGRALPEDVADQFVQMIQSQQATFQQKLATQSGGTVVQPADAGLQAEQLVESQFEDQLRVQNAATFAGTMDQMIKGLAQ